MARLLGEIRPAAPPDSLAPAPFSLPPSSRRNCAAGSVANRNRTVIFRLLSRPNRAAIFRPLSSGARGHLCRVQQLSTGIGRPTPEPFMNERQREYFRAQAARLEGRDPAGGARDAPASAGREPEPPRPRRPRLLRDRPRDRAARPRPPAQADRQDRRRPAAHRRRHLRLLRGDRRADRLKRLERARSPRCRSRRRSATSGASGSIATIEPGTACEGEAESRIGDVRGTGRVLPRPAGWLIYPAEGGGFVCRSHRGIAGSGV